MTRRTTVARSALLAWLLVAVLAGGLLACGQGEEENGDGGSATEASADPASRPRGDAGQAEEDEEEAVPVEVLALGRGRIEAVLRFSTNLEAESEVQVVSQATRQVRQLLVEEGDDVRRGQVLLRLQDEEQRTALAKVESQLAKARREYDRQTNLYEQKLISEQAYTDATYELEQLELAERDARRELSYTEVTAPIGGTVTERLVNLGDQVTINQPLFRIVDFDSIVARVYVPEKELPRIRTGLPARILADAVGGDPRQGVVERIAPRVDPRSGTVKVTVSVPRSQELLPGMYVSVALVTDVHEDALLVPKKALVYDADQLFVFRLVGDGDRVERLLIQAALEDRSHVEPAGILEDGDRVVVAGQTGLKDGSLIRVIGEPGDEAEAAGAAGGGDSG